MEVIRYELLEEREDGLCRFAERGSVHATAGTAGALIPPFEHHVLANAHPDRASLTLHVYGGEMTHCDIFQPLAERRRLPAMYPAALLRRIARRSTWPCRKAPPPAGPAGGAAQRRARARRPARRRSSLPTSSSSSATTATSRRWIPAAWRLTVDGLVERPLALSLADLAAPPPAHGRRDPPVRGQPPARDDGGRPDPQRAPLGDGGDQQRRAGRGSPCARCWPRPVRGPGRATPRSSASTTTERHGHRFHFGGSIPLDEGDAPRGAARRRR